MEVLVIGVDNGDVSRHLSLIKNQPSFASSQETLNLSKQNRRLLSS